MEFPQTYILLRANTVASLLFTLHLTGYITMVGNGHITNSYKSLKHDLLLEPRFLAGLNYSDIALLVVNFEPQIQSKRVCSHIQDLEALLSILENRNILKPDNVQSLRDIARLVRRDLAAGRVEEYNRMLATLSQHPLVVIPQSTPIMAAVPSELTRKGALETIFVVFLFYPLLTFSLQILKIVLVFEKVASNLGTGWRCIFRSRPIDLPEAFLSQLAQSNGLLQEKAYQVNIRCISFSYS